MVDRGDLVAVFDFSTGDRRRRLLRFLAAELEKPGAYRKAAINQLIVELLPQTRTQLSAREIAQWFSLERVQVWLLVRKKELAGSVKNHTLWITRASCEQFLRRRWCGAVVAADAKPNSISARR